MSWYNLLENLVTTRQIKAELAALTTERDAYKQANAALSAENAALKEQISRERKQRDQSAQPLSYPRMFVP